MKSNAHILDITKEIVVAKLSSSTMSVNEVTGHDVAVFMDVIYKKLVELNKNEDSNLFPKS